MRHRLLPSLITLLILGGGPSLPGATCARPEIRGFLGLLDQASLVVLAQPVGGYGGQALLLEIEEVLVGDAPPGIIPVLLDSFVEGQPDLDPLPPVSLWFLGPPLPDSSRRTTGSPIDPRGVDELGSLELVRDLASLPREQPGARVRPLAQACAGGGSRTRLRAALDLEGDARHLDHLAGQTLILLRTAVLDREADRATPVLLRLLWLSGAGDRVPVTLAVLAGPAGDAVLPVLRRLVRTRTIHITAPDLEPLLTSSDVLARRRATELLGCLLTAGAPGRLLELLEDPDPDVVSRALVGLAGRAPPEVLQRCRDHLQGQVDTAPADLTPVGRLLAARRLQQLRACPYEGSQLRTMAAGFVLLRAGGAHRRFALEHLDRLTDRSVGRLLRALASAPWADLEAAW